MKTVFKYILWFLSICALLVFSFALLGVANSLNHTAETAQKASKELRETINSLPDTARASSNKAVGGAIDAANPLRNAVREAKTGAEKAKQVGGNVKSEVNKGLKKAGIPVRL